MNTIRCPNCDEPLPESANYCPVCGISRASSGDQPEDQWLEIRRSVTWSKEVALSPNRANPTPLPPRPARSRPPMWNTWRRIRYRISPTIIIWISILVFLLCGSVFGIVTTRGYGISSNSHEPALQVTPDNVSVGATVIINGEHFNPYGKIDLTRDTSIPIQDTANATILEADNKGNFTDTLVITPDWEVGLHTVNAEDAFIHKIASFSIMVTGYATSLRPAHLRVSVDTLDLGSADQATNTTKTITLTNIGEGLISWQANSSQSWLLLSPSRGTFASGHRASILAAIDRSQLNPGAYSAQINIFSTAGNTTIPVTAAVTTYSPILQTNSALLPFPTIAAGPSSATKTTTARNPGLYPLPWQATTNCTFTVALASLNFTGISGQVAPLKRQIALQIAPSCANKLNWTATTDGSNWLSASVTGTSTPTLNVSASLAHLNANNYSGTVTITAYDSVTNQLVGIPQIVPIALTTQPACTLQNPSTTTETFDTKVGENPASQTFTISVSGTCSGIVTIAPSIIYILGSGWVSVVANTTTLASGESATFTVTVVSAKLPASQYAAIIQLSASNNGIAMLNTPQGIDVKLNVEASSDPAIETPTPSSSPTPVSTPALTPTPASSPTLVSTPIVTPALPSTPIVTPALPSTHRLTPTPISTPASTATTTTQ